VIEVDGRPAGRLYVDRRPQEIRLVEISLLPEHRGSGVGSRLIRSLLEEARESARMVTIHVEKVNRALRLYERMGFEIVADKGVYWFLEWRGEPAERRGAED
jgi:ribosomal protein S18 acetylase RimI-like enzyme